MPSLPTSLIIVCLVVAWLVVLVPMVAKRREEVPENLDDTGSARVLERGSRIGRRRAVLSRTAMAHRTRGPESLDAAGEVVMGQADADRDESVTEVDEHVGTHDETTDSREARSVAAGSGSIEDGHEVAETGDRGEFDSDREDIAAERVDVAASPERSGSSVRAERSSRSGREYQRVAPDAEPRWEREPSGLAGADSEPSAYARFRGQSEDVEYRSAPARPGRGGFNPAAADRARAYRFRQRRRVTLALLVIAVAGAVAGWLGVGFGYPAAVAGGVLLVLYFAYLRRQVRIEAEIRQRRLARLDRAAQIRPGYRPSVAEQVYAHRTGELPRPGAADEYQVRSHARGSVPPVGSAYGVPVDLEDSDPAFDDLEYYRPAVYRRRAG